MKIWSSNIALNMHVENNSNTYIRFSKCYIRNYSISHSRGTLLKYVVMCVCIYVVRCVSVRYITAG